jgi:hypothetical protein
VNLLPHDIEAGRRNLKHGARLERVEPERKIMVGEGGKDEQVM